MGGSRVPPLHHKKTVGCRLEIQHPATDGVGEGFHPLPSGFSLWALDFGYGRETPSRRMQPLHLLLPLNS